MMVAGFGGVGQEIGISGFPVGASVVLERKTHNGNPVTVVPEIWTTVGAIALPAHQVGPLGPVELHTIVCKAHRTD